MSARGLVNHSSFHHSSLTNNELHNEGSISVSQAQGEKFYDNKKLLLFDGDQPGLSPTMRTEQFSKLED